MEKLQEANGSDLSSASTVNPLVTSQGEDEKRGRDTMALSACGTGAAEEVGVAKARRQDKAQGTAVAGELQ